LVTYNADDGIFNMKNMDSAVDIISGTGPTAAFQQETVSRAATNDK